MENMPQLFTRGIENQKDLPAKWWIGTGLVQFGCCIVLHVLVVLVEGLEVP